MYTVSWLHLYKLQNRHNIIGNRQAIFQRELQISRTGHIFPFWQLIWNLRIRVDVRVKITNRVGFMMKIRVRITVRIRVRIRF